MGCCADFFHCDEAHDEVLPDKGSYWHRGDFQAPCQDVNFISLILLYFDEFPLPAAPIFVSAYLSKSKLDFFLSLSGRVIFSFLCARDAFC